jgi:phosphoglycerate dehydrogenase-like enzyme
VGALKSGQLAYAGLDVFKDEPLKPGNALLGLPQLLVTPHVAGTTDINLKGMITCLSVNAGPLRKPRFA